MTHICVSKLTIIGSDYGLSPDRRQAIIWTNAGILLIGPLGTNFSEILIAILAFSLKKMLLKVSSAKRRPFCLGLNMLSKIIDLASSQMNWMITKKMLFFKLLSNLKTKVLRDTFVLKSEIDCVFQYESGFDYCDNFLRVQVVLLKL